MRGSRRAEADQMHTKDAACASSPTRLSIRFRASRILNCSMLHSSKVGSEIEVECVMDNRRRAAAQSTSAKDWGLGFSHFQFQL